MFGVHGHCYLDTVRYQCVNCSKSFRATNVESLSLDTTGGVRATFGIHLLKRCAVDDELYAFVTSSSMTATAKLHKTLQDLYMKRYTSLLLQYLQLLQQAKQLNKQTRQTPQSILQSFLVTVGEAQQPTNPTSALQHQQLRKKRMDLKKSNRKMLDADRKRKRDIPLREISGIGVSKRQKFERAGISSSAQLLFVYEARHTQPRAFHAVCQEFQDRQGPTIVMRYANKVLAQKEALNKAFNVLEQQVQQLEGEVQQLSDSVETHSSTSDETQPASSELPATSNNETTTFEALPFGKFDDPGRYRGRFFSKYYIESVQQSHFRDRKPGMVHRMLNLGGFVLSLDFCYGPATRIRVYANGKPFTPWKGMATILNEDNMVIWWAFLEGSESIDEIAPSLRKLKLRLDRVQGLDQLKVIYVDNCCDVRAKLQAIFGPNVLVKLDIYHWQARWDAIILDKDGERYAVFRGLMSRAVLEVAPAEFEEKKNVLLQKLKRQPTVKEVRKLCKKKTPPAEQIEKSVRAIVEYFLLEDARTVASASTSTPTGTPDTSEALPQPKLFFKGQNMVRDTLRKQLRHVCCMCDPPGVNLYRTTTSGKTNCCRGSNSNEICNRFINREVLPYGIVSVQRADRCCWTLFDGWNANANVRRRGAVDYHTTNTEALALANSLSNQLELPLEFPDVSLPSDTPPASEMPHQMGFEMSGGELLLGDASEDNGDDEGDEDDLEPLEVAPQDNTGGDDDSISDEPPEVQQEADRIHQLITAVYTADVSQNETSLQTFTRLTNNNPWLPFTDKSDNISKEERRLFHEMSHNYNRHARPSATSGYKAFRDAWNAEAGRRYLARLAGEEDVTMIFRKSVDQLRLFFDRVEEQKALARSADQRDNDAELRGVNRILRDARNQLSEPGAENVGPLQYPQGAGHRFTPLGAPLTLNTRIAFPHGCMPAAATNTAPSAAPFNPLLLSKQIVPAVRAKISFRSICKKCGRLRKAHPDGNRGIGVNCPFPTCARCHQLQMMHVGGRMGTSCGAPKSYQTDAYDSALDSLKRKQTVN